MHQAHLLLLESYRRLQASIVATEILLQESTINGQLSKNKMTQQCTNSLTKKEREVLLWIQLGYTTKEIAIGTKRSVGSVEAHRTRILRKTNFKTTARLLYFMGGGGE